MKNKIKKRKINKNWHPLTVEAVLNSDNPGQIKYNSLNNTFERLGCPCSYSKPCNPRCTCIDEYSSFGCLNCNAYGQKT